MNPGFPENMEGDLGQKNNDNTLFDFNLLQTLIAQNFKQVSLDRNVEEVLKKNKCCFKKIIFFFQILVDMSNEFLENLLELAANIAKHRGSDAIDAKDIKIAFSKYLFLTYSSIYVSDKFFGICKSFYI